MKLFNLFDFNFIFSEPNKVDYPFSWVGHIPFAFFIIKLLKPEVFVELGVHSGNSFNAFCQTVQVFNLPTICYGVDTWHGDKHAGFYEEEVYYRVYNYQYEHYSAFSNLLKMTFDEACKNFSEGSIGLLHIDGLHTYEAVKHDFETWLPKMKQDGVIIFHDITERSGDFGVWRLWDELKVKYSTIEFSHSHGLGVVFLGFINNEVKQFVRDFNEGVFLKLLFQNAGNSINDKARLKEIIRLLEENLEQKNQEIISIVNSRSWRLTAPLRRVFTDLKVDAKHL